MTISLTERRPVKNNTAWIMKSRQVNEGVSMYKTPFQLRAAFPFIFKSWQLALKIKGNKKNLQYRQWEELQVKMERGSYFNLSISETCGQLVKGMATRNLGTVSGSVQR